jgi:hypothetical protein
VVSCAALAAATILAAHHPLSPAVALLGLALWFAACLAYPGLWLFMVPAALPAANLSPWTGWIAFEEFDLLVLGALAAGHARRAWSPAPLTQATRTERCVAAALALLAGIGLYRGIADAGGWSFDWHDGYGQPLNSVRLFKPLLYTVLAWPLAREELRKSPGVALGRLRAGMLVGVLVVTAAVLWERAAYPGLLDFTEPYRTVALFWEMHVGGAAIDAYLVLAAPFVAWAWWSARRPAHWAATAVVTLLFGYACLTTFSRGTYMAVLLPAAMLGAWAWAHRPDARPVRARWLLAGGGAVVIVLHLAFGTLGYAGAGMSILVAVAAMVLLRRVGVLSGRLVTGLAVALGIALEVVAVLGPGSFMRERLATSDDDSGRRLAHWRAGIGLLDGPGSWLLGLGSGRLPARYAASAPKGEFSGAAQRVEEAPGDGAARIDGPQGNERLGGQFGLTQRVASRPAYRVAFDIGSDARTDVYLHACERHLLYDGSCQKVFVRLGATGPAGRRVSLPLRGPALDTGGFPFRTVAFTISVTNPGGTARFDNISLSGPDGANLLSNGDFSKGFAHWLPGAQDYFVPWHLDNLYLEVLVERGIAGLLVLGGILAGSLRGLARAGHGCPPFLAACVLGALCLGTVSSVLDVPRTAFLLGLLWVMGYELARNCGDHLVHDRIQVNSVA